MNQTTDTSKTEAFMGKMMGIYNGAMLAFMVSIGHQARLFDAMAGLPASTSEDIAQAAGLNERYVREWLGSMVTGGIVEYEPSTRTYRLPAEHAAALTRAAGPKNVATLAPQFAMMGRVEPKIIDCFANGG